MATKVAKTEAKVPVLKGQEAEDKILEYLKRMNRPYGAVDVAANLKGAVPKTAAQKILVSLAEKGELVQKLYGKTTFFVVNQAKIDTLPPEKLTTLESNLKAVEEENKTLIADLRLHSSELAKLKATPTDADLDDQILAAEKALEVATKRLEPLRSGAPLMSADELALVGSEWTKWRTEWMKRRKVFNTFWQLATDTLPPQDATNLAEDLGIEFDTPEHSTLEQTPLCKDQASLKRKR